MNHLFRTLDRVFSKFDDYRILEYGMFELKMSHIIQDIEKDPLKMEKLIKL